MAENVQVQCCHCKGKGEVEHYMVGPDGKITDMPFFTDPFHMVTCPTCNGFGVVIATELRKVEKWEPLPRAGQ